MEFDSRDAMDFYDSAGLSCQLLYRINGLENAAQLLFQLVRGQLPVSRINAMFVAPDLSILIPVFDTDRRGIKTVKHCPAGKIPPFLSPESDPLQVLCLNDLSPAVREFLRYYPATEDLPFVGHKSLLRIPLFTKGAFIFLFQFWSRQKFAFPEKAVTNLLRLTRPLAEALSSSFDRTSDLAPETESCTQTGYDCLCLCDGLAGIREQVEQVAPTGATVLLLGETGVGKEVVAESLHELSGRKDKPFIRVNCGAITESLAESAFFGHEKGAFTGAHMSRAGYLESAEGGTLFLDEIGELSAANQARLLRVFDSGTFQRVGSTRTLSCNVRLIAATNRDLAEMVRKGTFRQDLYYRLTTFPLRIPPLRERKMDIPALVRHFTVLKAKELNISLPPEVDAETLKPLFEYNWPGNVRELEHVVERAMILAKAQHRNSGLVFNPEFFCPAVKENESAPRPEESSQAFSGIEAPSGCGNTSERTMQIFAELGWPSLSELEQTYLRAAVKKCQGQLGGKKGASTLLGIHYTTLRAKLNRA